jgi:molecular chaperone DnaJ
VANRDFYNILGISRDADAESIKKAYRKLAMKYHPDRNKEDSGAEDRFKEVGEAYAVLSNADKRARYDRYGEAGLGGSGGYSNADIDPFEIFRSFMGGFGFGDIFSESGGRSRRERNRGGDLQINLKLTLNEIADGVTKKIRVSRHNRCETCNGSGQKEGSKHYYLPHMPGSR